MIATFSALVQLGENKNKNEPRPAVSGFIEVLILIAIAIVVIFMISAWFAQHEAQTRQNILCSAWIDIETIHGKNIHWGKITIQNTGHTTIHEYHILHDTNTITSTHSLVGGFTFTKGTAGVDVEPLEKTIIEFTYNNTSSLPFDASTVKIQGISTISGTSSTFCKEVLGN